MSAKTCPVCGQTYGPEVGFCQLDGAKLMASEEAKEILADEDPLVRTLIGGRYRVLKRVGEGGMGMVYLAEHEAIEKRVAVKVLKEQYAQREDVVARFQQEAKSASRVKHEGVLEVFDFGRTEDGRFFLAMELLDGADIAHVLDHEGAIEPSRAVRFMVKISRALAAAHSKGVIHRDMKPENVFVRSGDDGREHIKIVDFGIAQLRSEGENSTSPDAKISGRKLTKTGMIFGTPEYMSPEQAAGKNIDQRVDIYACGIILFELLTGRTPFQGETFMAILSAHLMQPIPHLAECAKQGFSCSPELEGVVRRALAKEPDARYASMTEMAEALLQTPEGLSDESLQRPSQIARSSQFPSGMNAAPHGPVAPTDVRMRSQFPPPAAGTPAKSGTGSNPGQPPATMVGEVAATGRSHTTNPEIATTTTASVAPKKGNGATIAIVMVLIIGVVGVGGYFGYRAVTGDTGGTTSGGKGGGGGGGDDPKPKASTTKASTNPTETAAVPDAGPVAPTVKTVNIHVESTPPGATIERQVDKDWVQVCDTSPCDIPIPAGQSVALRAVKGAQMSPVKKLLADHDQGATLALGAATAPGTIKPTGSNKPKLCEVTLDEGIKVWRPCAP